MPREGAEIVAWLCCDPLPPIPLGPEPTLSIGRTEPARLVLPHKEVSRRHALLKVRGKALLIEDEGSSNGVYLNGHRVSSASLKVGDRLAIGPYELEIRSHEQMAHVPEGSTPEGHTSVQLVQPGVAMSGRLEEVDATELLQQLEFTSKTGTLTVHGARGLEGELVVREGRPLRARLGPARDEEAVIQLALLRAGRFTFAARAETGEGRIQGTLTGLLLEASRRRDEGGPPAPAELEPAAATVLSEPADVEEQEPASTDVVPGAPGSERPELPEVKGEMGARDWQSFWDA